jgi:hypothetical protein
MSLRESYNRFAQTSEGVGVAAGLMLNTLIAFGTTVTNLREGRYGEAGAAGALTIALGAACADICMRHDLGHGLTEAAGVPPAPPVAPNPTQPL